MNNILIIRLNALVFALYGIGFIVAPQALAMFVTGGTPATASGLIDMRATYGGLSLAIGGLLFLLSRGQERTGLLGIVFIMLAMALARGLGMVVDGEANAIMQIYLALEIMMAAVALALLARHGQP